MISKEQWAKIGRGDVLDTLPTPRIVFWGPRDGARTCITLMIRRRSWTNRLFTYKGWQECKGFRVLRYTLSQYRALVRFERQLAAELGWDWRREVKRENAEDLRIARAFGRPVLPQHSWPARSK